MKEPDKDLVERTRNLAIAYGHKAMFSIPLEVSRMYACFAQEVRDEAFALTRHEYLVQETKKELAEYRKARKK